MALLDDTPTQQPPRLRKWGWVPWLTLGVIIGATSCFAAISLLGGAGSPKEEARLTPAADAMATCQASVPGAQHAMTVTVGQVRALRPGKVQLLVPNFASGLAPDQVAYYCYRYEAAAKTSEVWATAPSGETVYLLTFADVSQDPGTFDPGATD